MCQRQKDRTKPRRREHGAAREAGRVGCRDEIKLGGNTRQNVIKRKKKR